MCAYMRVWVRKPTCPCSLIYVNKTLSDPCTFLNSMCDTDCCQYNLSLPLFRNVSTDWEAPSHNPLSSWYLIFSGQCLFSQRWTHQESQRRNRVLKSDLRQQKGFDLVKTTPLVETRLTTSAVTCSSSHWSRESRWCLGQHAAAPPDSLTSTLTAITCPDYLRLDLVAHRWVCHRGWLWLSPPLKGSLQLQSSPYRPLSCLPSRQAASAVTSRPPTNHSNLR